MDFGTVLRTLRFKPGAKLKRDTWPPTQFLYMDLDVNRRIPVKIMMKDGDYDGEWVPTQERILAENWEEVV